MNREELFKEMLNHARHQEKQRHNFLVVFIAIFSAVLSFLFKSEKDILNNNYLLLFFLILISLLGYGLTIIWNIAYYKYKFIAGKILNEIDLNIYEIFHKSKKNIYRAGTIYIIVYAVSFNLILFQCLNRVNSVFFSSLCFILCLEICYMLIQIYIDIKDYYKSYIEGTYHIV